MADIRVVAVSNTAGSRLEAARRAQSKPIKLSDPDAFERMRAAMAPLPSSPIDVECPGCKRGPGERCWNEMIAAPYGCDGDDFHSARTKRFIALTGGKDSTGSAHESDAGTARDSAPAHRGDSGTGRAAGSEARPSTRRVSQPAAPSGFKLCPGIRGRKCGANPGAMVLCGDCRAALDSDFRANRHRNVGILRADLDRPIPKPDALRTWPESWSSAGWESDP